MISSTRLADLFVEVADTLVDEFDLVDFLHTVSVHAAEVTNSSAVGVMLADRDGLRPMAASSEDARLLELFQAQHADGPCLECHRTGAEVRDIRLAESRDRWPLFVPQALAHGFATAHCFPLRLRNEIIGALNVFRVQDVFLGADERRVARALADVATIGLMQERAIRRAEELTEQLQFALNSRVLIEQAKGAVSRSLGVPVDEAFAILRAHARRRRLRLTELARAVVEDRATMALLADDL
jgi:transcriptional regulator with GAF, ATPase, and Fis domain